MDSEPMFSSSIVLLLGRKISPPACTLRSRSPTRTWAVPVWISRISSCPKCLCFRMRPPGGISSVPNTKCCEPLFFGLTLSMNSVDGTDMGTEALSAGRRRMRSSLSSFSSSNAFATAATVGQHLSIALARSQWGTLSQRASRRNYGRQEYSSSTSLLGVQNAADARSATGSRTSYIASLTGLATLLQHCPSALAAWFAKSATGLEMDSCAGRRTGYKRALTIARDPCRITGKREVTPKCPYCRQYGNLIELENSIALGLLE